jgi:splicing factor 3B subunit 1
MRRRARPSRFNPRRDAPPRARMGANARSRSPASASRRATRANDAEGDAEGDDDDAREIARLQRERRALDDATTTSRDARKGDDALDDERNDAREATTRATRTVKAPPRAYAPTAETLAGAPLDAEEDEDLESDEALGFGKSRRVIDRESDYSKRRFKRRLSPGKGGAGEVREDETRQRTRAREGDDAKEEEARFYENATMRGRTRRARAVRLTKSATNRVVYRSTQDGNEGRSYAERMKEVAVEREHDNTLRNIEKKQREEAERAADEARLVAAQASEPAASSARPEKRKRRWDAKPDDSAARSGQAPAPARASEWESDDSAATGTKWDDATPQRPSEWETMESGTRAADVKPTPRRSRSRWDETPMIRAGGDPSATPAWTGGETPVIAAGGETPRNTAGMATPSAAQIAAHAAMQSNVPLTPEQYQQMRFQREIEERNRPQTDEELDELLPSEGFKILEPPASYVPIRTPARKLMQTPMPYGANAGFFSIPEEDRGQKFDVALVPEGLPEMKPEDVQYFAPLLKETDEEALSIEEQKERKIMRLLLRVKNGTPQQRKTSLRQITDRAKEFGAGPLFNQILPLLMSPTLEDQERHLLVKVIDRILYKLDDLVRPYVHKILVVIEPLLIDEDYYARVEGREIISNVAKAAGLATMIAAMRPDIDNVDEYVRNTTARAFAVVAQALGVQSLLPFLKAVCQSKKSWQARHTGIKIIQQIAILHGCAVLPHLKSLVDIIENGLGDENQKVRTITALCIAALAEAATPYGIESFDNVLKPLWKGIRAHRGKVLAAFLKAIGFIIPLMDAMYANYYTREVMVILIREFATADEEMKKITLKVVKQCVATDGVEPEYIRAEVMPEFFKHFWVRRMALDRRNYQQLVETTLEVSLKVGAAEIIGRIVEDLKDESEPYRRMVMETITKVIEELGTADVDTRMEELLIDGMLYAFQEQTSDENDIMLKGVGTIVNALGLRAKPYLPQICGTIKWRMNNKSADIREQAADLISAIAPVMRKCEEEQLLGHLGVVLYEYLGEEYPEVLGSILGALKAIVSVQGMTRMTPPIKIFSHA